MLLRHCLFVFEDPGVSFITKAHHTNFKRVIEKKYRQQKKISQYMYFSLLI